MTAVKSSGSQTAKVIAVNKTSSPPFNWLATTHIEATTYLFFYTYFSETCLKPVRWEGSHQFQIGLTTALRNDPDKLITFESMSLSGGSRSKSSEVGKTIEVHTLRDQVLQTLWKINSSFFPRKFEHLWKMTMYASTLTSLDLLVR